MWILICRGARNAAGQIEYYEPLSGCHTEHLRLQQELMQAQMGRSGGSRAHAHDFNLSSPPFLGSAELASTSLGRRPAARGKKGRESASAMRRGLDAPLLALSRQQSSLRGSLNPNEVVAGMDKRLRRLLGEDVDCAPCWQSDLGAVKGGSHQTGAGSAELSVNGARRDPMSAS